MEIFMKTMFSSISRLFFAYSKFIVMVTMLCGLSTVANSSEATYLTCNDNYYRLTGTYYESNYNINKTTDENHKQLLLSLFYKYSLMIIPNQDIGKKDLINFTNIFGDPIEHPTNIKNRDIEFPQITIISNIKKNGFEIGALGSEEIDFHSDLVFCYKPGAVSILYCVDTPPTGGNTYWTDNISALKELNPDITSDIYSWRPGFHPETN